MRRAMPPDARRRAPHSAAAPARAACLLLLVLLAGCAGGPQGSADGPELDGPILAPDPDGRPDDPVEATFTAVAARIEPAAEAQCTRRAPPGTDCDFAMGLDTRADAPANGFQTLDALGRPVVILTRALVMEAANEDEIAFALAHEAAHHIEGHIAKTRVAALRGQALAGALAQASGADEAGIRRASELGLAVGARRYSKDFELEADRLGTVIVTGAGFDAVRGVQFFNRLPDPGDRFLGTHPPNADRIAAVRRVAARL